MPELKSMTREQLQRHLDNYPADMHVVFKHPANDYWRSTIATPVTSLQTASISYSGYHEQFVLQGESYEPDAEDKHPGRVIVLG